MQLTFTDKLYREPQQGEKNILKNLEMLIKNFKYLRAHLETHLGNMYDSNPKFDKYSEVTNKIGFCLFWLATLGYLKNQEFAANYQSKDTWYDKTIDKVFLSASQPLSTADMYKVSRSIESLSKELILTYKGTLASTDQQKRLVEYYKYSLKDLVNSLYKLKK
jgi:ribosomal protein S15P/S13E